MKNFLNFLIALLLALSFLFQPFKRPPVPQPGVECRTLRICDASGNCRVSQWICKKK